MDPMLKIIDDVNPAKNLNRVKDLEKNCQSVRSEFVGKPEVCHQLVIHIIHLRRGIDVHNRYTQFKLLLDKYFDVLLKNYDVRWLLSILDTIADHGDPLRSATAMLVVSHLNHINIHYNITDSTVIKNFSQSKNKVPTWGGMISADVHSGDMIHNMVDRVNKIVKRSPDVNRVWQEIKTRAKSEKLLIDYLIEHNRFRKRFLQ